MFKIPTSVCFNNMCRFQEAPSWDLGHEHMKRSLDYLGKLAWNCSCIWDYILGLHIFIWNALHERDFVLTRHGVWEHVAKVCRNRPYVSIRKAMTTNLRWLDGRPFIFLQLVRSIILSYSKWYWKRACKSDHLHEDLVFF